MKRLTKKGVTLLELMIALAVLSILIAVVSPFFFSNYKALHESDIRMELQDKGDKIIEDLTNKALQAKSIKSIKDSKEGKVSLDTKDEVDISSIEFNNGDSFSEFQLQPKDKDYVNYIKITPLPSTDGTLETAKGIQVDIELQKRKIKKELQTKIYFRNSD